MSSHTCHAIGCKKYCKPEHLMCSKHWAMVGLKNQIAVYKNYRPGQCDDKQPSKEWFNAANAAIEEVASKTGHKDVYDMRQKAKENLIESIRQLCAVGDDTK